MTPQSTYIKIKSWLNLFKSEIKKNILKLEFFSKNLKIKNVKLNWFFN